MKPALRIHATDLWTYRIVDGGGAEREPLARLGREKNSGHVHGALRIEIGGRTVPHLGYEGPDDVCLNTWVVELCNVVRALSAEGVAYAFGEGEQADPPFRFARIGDEVAFSILSTADGTEPDPGWQDVRFPYAELRPAVARFLEELRDELRREAPTWQTWWPRDASLSDV